MADPSDEDVSSSLVTELFIEFLQVRESSSEPNLDDLCERAGALAEELRGRIEEHESLKSLGATMLPGEDIESPVNLGRFEGLELIGKGGMGHVYVARDTALQRKVALKIVSSPDGLFGARGAWALNEARSLARLEHPGVVRVLDVDKAEGRVFLVMELMAGPSMSQVIEALREWRSAPAAGADTSGEGSVAQQLQDLRPRLHCLADIARALAFCHDRGVLHRDIKPSNVLFSPTGEPKLIDFGLAHIEDADDESKVDTTQSFRGTPAYFSPEQIEIGRTGADPRCEIFSFGTLCYELLSLEHPFRRPTRQATLDAVLLARPEPLRKHDASIPPEVERVVHHCLERDPADRYPNLDAAAADLAALLENRPISVEEPSVMRVLLLWAKRHRRRLRLSASLAAVTACILGGFWLAITGLQHSRINNEVSSFQVAQLRWPSDFRTGYGRASRLLDEAMRFDAGILRSRLLPGLTKHTRARIEELSLHMGEVVSAESPERMQPWSVIVHLDEELNPQGEHNQALRDRGQVEFVLDRPDLECILYLQSRALEQGFERAIRTYKELDVDPIVSGDAFRFRDLSAGVYRLVAWRPGDDQVYGEVEFGLESMWEPLKRFSILEPADGIPTRHFEQSMLSFNRTRAGDKIVLFATAIRASEVITNADYRSFCRLSGYALPAKFPTEGSDSLAAKVSWIDAAECARWMRGRLPTALELNAIHAASPIVSSEPGSAYAEWVSDSNPTNSVSMKQFLKYMRLGQPPWLFSAPPVPQVVPSEDGVSQVVGFRVVYSADSREAFERASRPVR